MEDHAMPNQDRYCIICGQAGSYLDFSPPYDAPAKQRCPRYPEDGCGLTVAWLDDDSMPSKGESPDALGDLSVAIAHLLPDIVITDRSRVDVIDAKYKAHFAELDERGWCAFTEDAREAHRADVHQILACASLFDGPEVRAILVCPLREDTWRNLCERGRDVSVAELFSGQRRVQLELRGMPFGPTVERSC
jgi:hypothetical protein